MIVEAPVNGIDAAHVRYNSWQFRQILGRGVHGILLCQAESADAVRAFVESCRYPHQIVGVDPDLPSPLQRMAGAPRLAEAGNNAAGRKLLGIGTRGRGSESTAAPVWGLSSEAYMARCDPWPLNPDGELMLGVKLESPEGIANCEAIIRVPGLAFAEIGPGDLSLSLGYRSIPSEPYPAEMQAARDRVLAACRENGVAFLQSCTAETIISRIDEGVRVVAGHSELAATKGRAYQNRTMPV